MYKGLENAIIKDVARFFNIEVEYDDDGYSIDLDTYDWRAGCSSNGMWLCPKAALDCALSILEDYAEDYMDSFDE